MSLVVVPTEIIAVYKGVRKGAVQEGVGSQHAELTLRAKGRG